MLQYRTLPASNCATVCIRCLCVAPQTKDVMTHSVYVNGEVFVSKEEAERSNAWKEKGGGVERCVPKKPLRARAGNKSEL